MKNFSFIMFATGLDPDGEGFADGFYDAGCSDALVAFQKGKITLYFDRDAKTVEEAIASAIKDVTSTGAQVLHIKMEDESQQATTEDVLARHLPHLGLLKALDAIHFHVDATDEELRLKDISREEALTQARDLREKLDPYASRELRWSCY